MQVASYVVNVVEVAGRVEAAGTAQWPCPPSFVYQSAASWWALAMSFLGVGLSPPQSSRTTTRCLVACNGSGSRVHRTSGVLRPHVPGVDLSERNRGQTNGSQENQRPGSQDRALGTR